MENVLPFLLPLALLACPLMMVGMGVGAWVLARAKGEKKKLSMGCMMGQCEHEEHAPTEETKLKEQVARLEHQVDTLRTQVRPSTNRATMTEQRDGETVRAAALDETD